MTGSWVDPVYGFSHKIHSWFWRERRGQDWKGLAWHTVLAAIGSRGKTVDTEGGGHLERGQQKRCEALRELAFMTKEVCTVGCETGSAPSSAVNCLGLQVCVNHGARASLHLPSYRPLHFPGERVLEFLQISQRAAVPQLNSCHLGLFQLLGGLSFFFWWKRGILEEKIAETLHRKN